MPGGAQESSGRQLLGGFDWLLRGAESRRLTDRRSAARRPCTMPRPEGGRRIDPRPGRPPAGRPGRPRGGGALGRRPEPDVHPVALFGEDRTDYLGSALRPAQESYAWKRKPATGEFAELGLTH